MDKLISFFFIFKEPVVSVIDWIETHSDFITAAATAAIALFTLRLWIATKKLWKVSLQQSKDMKTSLAIAKDSADAAKQSAEVAETALHVAERAYLRIDGFELVNFSIGDYINVRYEIHNVGHTPAQILESLTIVDIVEKDSFKIPIYDIERGLAGPKQAFIQPGEKASMIGISKNIVTPEEFHSVKNNDKLIFTWGKIIIRDVFGKMWINGFGAVFSQVFGLTMMDGYNYTKEYEQDKEKP